MSAHDPLTNERASLSQFLPRVQFGGIWKGRGHVKVIVRPRNTKTTHLRLKRRNPVDHKRARIGRMEVWW